MRANPYLSALVVILLALGLAAALVGCTGGNDAADSMVSFADSQPAAAPIESTSTTVVDETIPAEDLSTFESKDPFIQQVSPSSGTTDATDYSTQPLVTAPATTPPTNPPTTYYNTSTTRYPGTLTTWRNTTTTRSTTTTTKPPTTTTSSTTTTVPRVHTLKVLSVDTIDGAPAVTFRVDTAIYKNQPVGAVVSTSWGEVQVVDINVASKLVTLLHGGETLTMEVGDEDYE